MNDQADVLQATGISKRFGAHWALRDVDLRVRPGEVHGLLGQNGSGKSTLIKVLAGFHTPEAGSLEMSGRRLSLPVTGKEHREYRMRFVHQDLALVPSMSVADNFTLDQLVAAPALTRARSAGDAASVEETLRQWGLDVSPHALVEHLTRLERAKVAIVKAVSDFTPATAGGLLVLDEPTAFLPPDEAESLFATMRRVADSGAGVLFVSHNLDEIMHHTDRVTVLRDGLQVGSVPIADTSVEAVVELILGRSADEVAPAAVAPIDDAAVPVVRVRGLRAPELAPMELAVQPGEIVGLTGLIGSGFERVPLLLFGAEAATAGSLAIGTDPAIELSEQTPARAVAAGIGYVPSDRLGEATAPSLTVGENATLLRLNRLRNRLGGVPRKPIAAEAHRLIAPVDVRPDDPTLPLTALSGGNQQKVVLAKWLSISPRLLLISEPTQGVDIGARHQIAAILRELAASGCAVICASSDLDQLTELCDRILVFRDGEVTAEVRGAELSKHALMLALFATPTRLDAGGLDEKELKR